MPGPLTGTRVVARATSSTRTPAAAPQRVPAGSATFCAHTEPGGVPRNPATAKTPTAVATDAARDPARTSGTARTTARPTPSGRATRLTISAATATSASQSSGWSRVSPPRDGRTYAAATPSSQAYGQELGPCQTSAHTTAAEPAAASGTTGGSRAPRSTSRVSGAAVTSSNPRNAAPTPASVPKWCVHFDGVSPRDTNPSAVAEAVSTSGAGSGIRRARAATASTANQARASRQVSTAARRAKLPIGIGSSRKA